MKIRLGFVSNSSSSSFVVVGCRLTRVEFDKFTKDFESKITEELGEDADFYGELENKHIFYDINLRVVGKTIITFDEEYGVRTIKLDNVNVLKEEVKQLLNKEPEILYGVIRN